MSSESSCLRGIREGSSLPKLAVSFLLEGAEQLAAAKQAAEQAQEAAKGERGRLVIGSVGPVTVAF